MTYLSLLISKGRLEKCSGKLKSRCLIIIITYLSFLKVLESLKNL